MVNTTRYINWILIFGLSILYPIHRSISVYVGNINTSFGDLVIAVTIFLFIFGIVGSYKLPNYIVYISTFAIITLLGLSFHLVIFPPWEVQIGSGLLELIKTLAAMSWTIAIFALLFNDHHENLTLLLYAFSIVGAVLSLHAITSSLFFDVTRPSGPFENPNIFANYLLLILFSQLSIAATQSRRIIRSLSILFVFVTATAVFLTGSRGALLGLTGTAIFLFLFMLSSRPNIINHKIRIFIITFPLAALFIIISSQSAAFDRLITTISGISSGQIRNLEVRINLWTTAFGGFLERPWFGIGLGQFPNYASYTGLETEIYPHNTYLRFLSETGIFGLATFLLLFLSGLKDSLRNNIVHGDMVSIYFFGFVLATLGQGVVTDIEHFRALWISLGIISSRSYHLSKQS